MKTPAKTLLVASLLVAISLACSLSGIEQKARQVESAAQTAQALATAGKEALSTVEASGLAQTAVALATQAEEKGLWETAQAAITALPQQSADLKATAEAVITQGAYGQAPPNIPVFPGEVSAFFGSNSLVSYTAAANVQTVIDFYRQQLPVYGWQPTGNVSVITSTHASLVYENATQRLNVAITAAPGNAGQSLVVINIFSK